MNSPCHPTGRRVHSRSDAQFSAGQDKLGDAVEVARFLRNRGEQIGRNHPSRVRRTRATLF